MWHFWPRETVTLLHEPRSSWPACAARVSAWPPSNGITSTSSPYLAKKPFATAMLGGVCTSFGGDTEAPTFSFFSAPVAGAVVGAGAEVAAAAGFVAAAVGAAAAVVGAAGAVVGAGVAD